MHLLSSDSFPSLIFSDLLSSSLLFSSLTLPTSAFHLSILSEVWLLNFLRDLHIQPITILCVYSFRACNLCTCCYRRFDVALVSSGDLPFSEAWEMGKGAQAMRQLISTGRWGHKIAIDSVVLKGVVFRIEASWENFEWTFRKSCCLSAPTVPCVHGIRKYHQISDKVRIFRCCVVIGPIFFFLTCPAFQLLISE